MQPVGSTPQAARDDSGGKLAWVFHVALCLLGLAATFKPDWSSLFNRSIIDNGDGELNNYFLEHSFQLLTNRAYPGTLWSPPFFYPAPHVLAYSDNLFGAAPIYWLFRVGLPPHAAMLGWIAACLVLDYAAFAWLLRTQRVGNILCGIGGFLFAFGMPRIMQISHPQLFPQFFTPLALIYLFAMLRAPSVKHLNLFLLLTFWQLLAGIYLGWFLAFGSVVCVVVALAFDGRIRRRLPQFVGSHAVAIAASLAAWAVLLLAFIHPYLDSPNYREGGWPFWAVDSTLPRLGSWFQPPPQSFWARYFDPWTSHYSMRHEHYMFDGAFAYLAALAALVTVIFLHRPAQSGRRRVVKISLLTFAAIFLLSWRFLPGASAWEAVNDWFPGARAIRIVTRIWTIADAFLLLGALVGLDALLRSISNRKSILIAASLLLTVLALSEQFTPPPSDVYSPFARDVNDQAQLIRGADAAFLVIGAGNGPGVWQNLSMMWAGINANVPVINGYSLRPPPGYNVGDRHDMWPHLRAWLGPQWHGKLVILANKKDAAYDALTEQLPNATVAQNQTFRAFTMEVAANRLP